LALTARSTSTPSARWMPPWRSRPRLRCFFASGAQPGTDLSKASLSRCSGGSLK